MKNIFLMGAYFTTKKEDIDLYPIISDFIKNNLENVTITQPIDIENFRENFIKENPKANLQQINEAMVNYDLDLIKKSDLLIVDLTNKSTGVGIELGVAKENNKKLVFFAKKDSKISNMVYGAFSNIPVFFYENLEELKSYLLTIKF